MAELNQNFTMFAGETKNIVVPVTSDNPDLDLTGADIKWEVRQKQYSATHVILKESPDITVEGNVLTIHLKPPDTKDLSGTYYHKCLLQDSGSVLFTGIVKIKI